MTHEFAEGDLVRFVFPEGDEAYGFITDISDEGVEIDVNIMGMIQTQSANRARKTTQYGISSIFSFRGKDWYTGNRTSGNELIMSGCTL